MTTRIASTQVVTCVLAIVVGDDDALEYTNSPRNSELLDSLLDDGATRTNNELLAAVWFMVRLSVAGPNAFANDEDDDWYGVELSECVDRIFEDPQNPTAHVRVPPECRLSLLKGLVAIMAGKKDNLGHVGTLCDVLNLDYALVKSVLMLCAPDRSLSDVKESINQLAPLIGVDAQLACAFCVSEVDAELEDIADTLEPMARAVRIHPHLAAAIMKAMNWPDNDDKDIESNVKALEEIGKRFVVDKDTSAKLIDALCEITTAVNKEDVEDDAYDALAEKLDLPASPLYLMDTQGGFNDHPDRINIPLGKLLVGIGKGDRSVLPDILEVLDVDHRVTATALISIFCQDDTMDEKDMAVVAKAVCSYDAACTNVNWEALLQLMLGAACGDVITMTKGCTRLDGTSALLLQPVDIATPLPPYVADKQWASAPGAILTLFNVAEIPIKAQDERWLVVSQLKTDIGALSVPKGALLDKTELAAHSAKQIWSPVATILDLCGVAAHQEMARRTIGTPVLDESTYERMFNLVIALLFAEADDDCLTSSLINVLFGAKTKSRGLSKLISGKSEKDKQERYERLSALINELRVLAAGRRFEDGRTKYPEALISFIEERAKRLYQTMNQGALRSLLLLFLDDGIEDVSVLLELVSGAFDGGEAVGEMERKKAFVECVHSCLFSTGLGKRTPRDQMAEAAAKQVDQLLPVLLAKKSRISTMPDDAAQAKAKQDQELNKQLIIAVYMARHRTGTMGDELAPLAALFGVPEKVVRGLAALSSGMTEGIGSLATFVGQYDVDRIKLLVQLLERIQPFIERGSKTTSLAAAIDLDSAASEFIEPEVVFKLADKDQTKVVDVFEFKETMKLYQLELSEQTIVELYAMCDRNASGLLSADEFDAAMKLVIKEMVEDSLGLLSLSEAEMYGQFTFALSLLLLAIVFIFMGISGIQVRSERPSAPPTKALGEPYVHAELCAAVLADELCRGRWCLAPRIRQ
jgi:hypothetical protein